MTVMDDIKVTRVKESRLKNLSLDQMAFGKNFTDHMFVVSFSDGHWHDPEIKPYQPITVSPACSAFHYGQSIFEGIKAFRNLKSGAINVFRLKDHFKRFNISAKRMNMPEISEDLFIEGIKELIRIDDAWVPNIHDHSLYIRPFMFANEGFIGVRPSSKYEFIIILSPTGPYYSKPLHIYAEKKYVRAAEGGVGYAKNAGNYGAAMYPTSLAKKNGYDQVLWMDAKEHKYVQECGTMNVFFAFGNTVVTPSLGEGTILDGVTRMSIVKLLGDMGYQMEERHLSLDEIKERFKKGELTEAFGTGTAAVVLMIAGLADDSDTINFDEKKWTVGPAVKQKLDAIREGSEPDNYGWLEVVE